MERTEEAGSDPDFASRSDGSDGSDEFDSRHLRSLTCGSEANVDTTVRRR